MIQVQGFNELQSFVPKLREWAAGIGLFKAFIVLLSFSLLNLLVEYPFAFVFTSLFALFLPGYLFSLLVLKRLDALEAVLLGVTMSMGLITIAVLLLHIQFDFPLTKETVIESAVLANTFFFLVLQARRFLGA